MASRTAWAVEIERMTPSERAHASKFSPYCLTPSGSLRLPLEEIRASGPRQWPLGKAPGWMRLGLPDGTDHTVWRPLGSEFYFGQQEQPFTVHAAPEAIPKLASMSSGDLLHCILRGEAFPFCGRVFILPEWKSFVMNSFQYDVDKMDKLPVFVGFRGHSREYEETLTPGLYRKHNGPSRAKWEKWMQCARVTGNVLKQRFLENENKPLTEIETIGILQHHYVIGPTDLLDFSYDVNIAKWFALNEHVHGVYRQKRFDSADRAADGRHASCVSTVAVRAIGILPLPEEHAHYATSGLTLTSWEDFGSMSPPAAAVPPWNLAPLWSKYPRRQKGFGVRGIGPGDIDEYGSVLSVAEYLFHPVFHETGWERIGGPEMVIDGQRFTFDQDSSYMAKFLFPEVPTWFKEAVSEIEQIVKP